MAQFKCTRCKEEFDAPEFGPCKKGVGSHVVEPQTYYHMGGASVADLRERRYFAPLVTLEAGTDYWDDKSKRMFKSEGLYVQFEQSGKYTTSDPKEQFLLEERKYPHGQEAYEKWCAVYLTPEQNINRKQAQLEEMDRQIKERNALLEETKKKLGAKA